MLAFFRAIARAPGKVIRLDIISFGALVVVMVNRFA